VGLEALLAALETRVAEEAARRLEEARVRAQALRERARAEADRLREERLAARRREWESRLAAEGAELRLRARAAILRSRADVLDRVRAGARRRLARLCAEVPPAVQARLVADALAYAPPEPAIALCAPEWAPVVRAACADRGATIAVQPDPGVHGIRIEARDGRWVIDHTLEGRLDRMWPRLATGIARELDESP
jgi:vacuolar-type H+-ATPase subunit E/Vma4